MKTKLPFEIIDLTHTLTPAIPTWGGKCGFSHAITDDYDMQAAVKFRIHKISMDEGVGTHIDAPAHCFPGEADISELALTELIAPCVVIDISKQADERYLLTVTDIEKFETKYGTIASGSFVIVYTGWDKFWDEPEKYRNNLLFPSISLEAAEMLLTRKIVGLGIDTLSPDGADSDFPVHQCILGANKYIVENVANAAQLPCVGAYSFVLPMNIKNGTEAPVRLIAVCFK